LYGVDDDDRPLCSQLARGTLNDASADTDIRPPSGRQADLSRATPGPALHSGIGSSSTGGRWHGPPDKPDSLCLAWHQRSDGRAAAAAGTQSVCHRSVAVAAEILHRRSALKLRRSLLLSTCIVYTYTGVASG